MTDVAAALSAVSDAQATVTANDSLLQRISQTVIAAIVVVVWGVSVILLFAWTLTSGESSGDFICNTPPAEGATIGTDCTNGWNATKDQLKDIFTFAVLPFVTLVIGFYFGQKSSEPTT